MLPPPGGVHAHPPAHTPTQPCAPPAPPQNVTTGFANLTAAAGGSASSNNGFAARLDGATGAPVWAWALSGAGEDALRGVAASPRWGVEVLGSFSQSVLVGPANLSAAGSDDVLIAALDAGTGVPLGGPAA